MKELITFLVVVGLFIGTIIGYVLNIVALCQAHEFSGFIVARILGVIIPFLGAVLGYF